MRVHLMLAACVLAAASGCDSCRPPPRSKGSGATGGAQPAAGAVMPVGEEKVHKAFPLVMPEAHVIERSGDVLVEKSESTSGMPGLSERQDKLYVGDTVITGADGEASLDIGQGSTVRMGPSTALSLGVYRPQEIVLRRGMASFSGEAIVGTTRRFKVMTPGALIFYAGPAMDVAVAASGEVLVDARDCPEREAVKTANFEREARARCTYVMSGEEQDLVTGDRLVIGPGLEVRRSRIGEGAPDPAAWLEERAKSLEKDPSTVVQAFAGWIGAALGDVRAFIDEIKTRRDRNKELLKKLRDLRMEGKPDASKAAAEAMEEGEAPVSEITGVKEELALNSHEQDELRHRLLVRLYQCSLHLELLSGHLDDEALAGVGKTVDELEEAVGGLSTEIHDLIARKPRYKPAFQVRPRMVGHPAMLQSPKKPRQKQ